MCCRGRDWNDLSKNTVMLMMCREMDMGAIQFDSATAQEILGFTHKFADTAGLK